MVDPGNPPHSSTSRAKTHSTRRCHRMVALAARSSGRSTEISSQTKITTVMLVYRVYLPQLARLAAISGYGLGGFRTKGAPPHYLDLPVSGAGRRPPRCDGRAESESPGRQHTRLALADDRDAVAQRKASVRIIGDGGCMSDGDARRRGDHAPDVRSGGRVATRVDIGAVRMGVQPRLHFPAAPEEGNGLAFDRNQSPCARISSGSAFPELYKKYSKSPQFDPITARHCGGNL